MPQIARITATFFTSMITRLGIRPPFGQGYEISNVVQPVSIVDADIAIPAAVTPVLTPAPNGSEQTAVAAGTVFATSGALAAGTYYFRAWIAFMVPATNRIIYVQHRDAADAANMWFQSLYPGLAVGGNIVDISWRESVSTNERVRIIAGSNMGAGESITANLFWTLL